MLQACKIKTYIKIDNKSRLLDISYGLTEGELPNVVATTYSFKDCFNTELPTSYITTDTTLFRKRPYVEIEYDWDYCERYYSFDSLTIEQHYEPYGMTLNELFRQFSADECIQYLKDRGITSCPILK